MFEDKFEVIKVFKGGSLSSTKLINHPEFKKCVLKKVSNSSNREYGFVRFCSQIKRHLQLQNAAPELFPQILKVGIDIEYKEAYCIYKFMEDYISMFDFLNDHLISDIKLKKAASNLISSLKKLHENEYKNQLVEGALEFYVKEEMIRPLSEYEKYLDTVGEGDYWMYLTFKKRTFLRKLVSCPYCVSFWLNLATFSYHQNIVFLIINIWLTLFLFISLNFLSSKSQ